MRQSAERIHREEQPLGELFSDLSRQVSTLLREEVELAKAEMSRKVARAVRDVAFLAIGALVAYAAFLVLLAAAVAGLGAVIPVGWAALLVGVAVGVVAAFLLLRGLRDLSQMDAAPRRTIRTLREDARWLKGESS